MSLLYGIQYSVFNSHEIWSENWKGTKHHIICFQFKIHTIWMAKINGFSVLNALYALRLMHWKINCMIWFCSLFGQTGAESNRQKWLKWLNRKAAEYAVNYGFRVDFFFCEFLTICKPVIKIAKIEQMLSDGNNKIIFC